jgi:hypothetical protein
MCELCSDDPAVSQMAREGCMMMAQRLRRLASFYENLADRRVKPHDGKAWDEQKHSMRFVAKEFLEIVL